MIRTGYLRWEIDVSDDRQKITFRLRPEARFSDGRPVTSADVVFSLETLRDKGLPRFKTYYSKIKTIEKPNPISVIDVMSQDTIVRSSMSRVRYHAKCVPAVASAVSLG